MVSISEADLTILYGSQTGNAEFLAFNISESATKAGLSAELLTLNDALQEGNLSWQRLLIVTSTHDNGHMPDNADAFWQWLQSLDDRSYAGLPYAVLAIGDSMYEDFCKTGQDFSGELERLGAVSMIDRIECDVDYDMTAAPWIKQFLAILPNSAPWKPLETLEVEADAAGQFLSAPEEWHSAQVTKVRTLTSPQSEKRVLHFDLEVPSGFTYLPGDSVDVMPENSPHLVDEWLAAFPGTSTVRLGEDTVSFREALTSKLELRLPNIGLINALTTRIPSSEAADRIKNLLDSGDRSEIDTWLWGRDVLDVVTELGFTGIDAQSIIDVMRPIQHRSYSIASSPTPDPSRLSLTVSAISYDAGGRSHLGTGTHYLEKMVGESIQIRRVVAHSFRLPDDDSAVIMIGPGVGIAPFIGFLQELEARHATNKTWLFFGSQHRASEWLYEREMRTWQESGVLTELDLAFSRDQAEKHYVQHDIRARAQLLRKWVSDGAHIYICGDKNRMAHDVEESLREVLSNGRNENSETDVLDELRASGRYAKDVY